jgi:hypothetical protein
MTAKAAACKQQRSQAGKCKQGEKAGGQMRGQPWTGKGSGIHHHHHHLLFLL